MGLRVGSSCVVLSLLVAAGCGQSPPPLVTSGTYWKGDGANLAPNVEFRSDGSGKMTYAVGGAQPQFAPVAFTWQSAGAGNVSIALQTGPAPAAPGGLQGAIATDAAAKPGEVVLTWSAVDGADFYNVYKVASGATFGSTFVQPGGVSSSFLTTTSFHDVGTQITYDQNGNAIGCSTCPMNPTNYDGSYEYLVTAVRSWVESPTAKVTVTVTGNPAPTGSGGGGAPSEGCSCPLPGPNPVSTPITDNWNIPGLDPTRFSNIVYNDPSSPTAFSTSVVTTQGTGTWKFTLASGSF